MSEQEFRCVADQPCRILVSESSTWCQPCRRREGSGARKALPSTKQRLDILLSACQEAMQWLGPHVPPTVDYTVPENALGLVTEVEQALAALRRAGVEYVPRKGRERASLPAAVDPAAPNDALPNPARQGLIP